jgi:hypothetical protein
MTPELELELFEAVCVKYGDINITISSLPDGLLYNKNQEEVFKYCADLLLQQTDESTLENKIEIPMAIQETLQKDFGWDKNKTFDFVRKLRHRLYLMNIGEYNKEEREQSLKTEREVRAQRKFEEDVATDSSNNVVVRENSVVVVIPKQQNFSEEDTDYPTQFESSGDTASAVQKSRPIATKPVKKPTSQEKS